MKRQRAKKGEAKQWLHDNVGHASDECLIWPFGCSTPGYGFFNDGQSNNSAHRYMCILAHGDPPSPTHEAAHECGNRRCVNPRHLSWKTKTENQLDRRKHGTTKGGKYNKLTLAQAEQIRSLKGKETSIETAAKYGITESNVRQIQDGKIWRRDRKVARPLSAEQVRTIRALGGLKSSPEIGRIVGTRHSVVWRVLTGRSYKHVPK